MVKKKILVKGSNNLYDFFFFFKKRIFFYFKLMINMKNKSCLYKIYVNKGSLLFSVKGGNIIYCCFIVVV